MLLEVNWIPDNRARHTMSTAATAAQLRAFNRDDLDTLLAQQCVGVDVSVVGDNDARLECNDVVAVVPLFALLFEWVTAGLNHAQRLEIERFLHHFEEV